METNPGVRPSETFGNFLNRECYGQEPEQIKRLAEKLSSVNIGYLIIDLDNGKQKIEIDLGTVSRQTNLVELLNSFD